jgi:peptidoglycan/xylan/chitin deacetylase (PgdA/CDA1 family)
MSSRIRKTAKAAALQLVASRASSNPGSLSVAAMRMMKIGLEPGMASGYDGGTRAACCISVDFDVTAEERYPWNHDGTFALLALSEKYGIPLTWAICGKTAVEDPKSYESILASAVKQDVGVHTYSHIYADKCTEAEYEEDIRRCISVLGLSSLPTSFVFPKNREGHFALLKRLGFRSFRGANRVIGAPVEEQGLWNIRPVYYLDPKSLRAARLVVRFIDACIARSAVFHLWTHPWSLAIDGRVDRMAAEAVEPIFSYLEKKKSQGLLSFATMRNLSEFMTRNQRHTPNERLE